MQLMGHAHIATTMVYVQISPREIFEQYARAVAEQIRPTLPTRTRKRPVFALLSERLEAGEDVGHGRISAVVKQE
jgi:hypothetical protein